MKKSIEHLKSTTTPFCPYEADVKDFVPAHAALIERSLRRDPESGQPRLPIGSNYCIADCPFYCSGLRRTNHIFECDCAARQYFKPPKKRR